MPDSNTAISVNGLEKSFKSLEVLKKVRLSVPAGSIFALLGPNGAGKTTIIKILTTLLKPDGGSAVVCGFDVVRQPEQVRESISLTGQNVAVDEVLTGRENLRMIARLHHLPDANSKAEELLKRFDFHDAADRRVATYSGGMRRRLDLAMSLFGHPRVIFLDEPTTGLDPRSRVAMWKIIKDLSNSGITVFLTTQYLEEADQLADQIAILNNGQIAAEGTPAELKKLLPYGHIEIRFFNEQGIQSARDLLQDYKADLDSERQTLTVTTGGSIRQMSEILNRLENEGIAVAELAQKVPTLDDVFLTLTSENRGKEPAK